MTPNTTAASVAAAAQTAATKPAAMTKDEVKKMLRDAAFVLNLTRRVKAEILAERPATKGTARKVPDLTAGLGV
ncbi:unnamed protein product [Gemmataceae bacterium]|nr:unnamed protein product [Gemmataceae bacterium]VTU01159.1 unnamed protein product [Gemmataceae bacterium]